MKKPKKESALSIVKAKESEYIAERLIKIGRDSGRANITDVTADTPTPDRPKKEFSEFEAEVKPFDINALRSDLDVLIAKTMRLNSARVNTLSQDAEDIELFATRMRPHYTAIWAQRDYLEACVADLESQCASYKAQRESWWNQREGAERKVNELRAERDAALARGRYEGALWAASELEENPKRLETFPAFEDEFAKEIVEAIEKSKGK